MRRLSRRAWGAAGPPKRTRHGITMHNPPSIAEFPRFEALGRIPLEPPRLHGNDLPDPASAKEFPTSDWAGFGCRGSVRLPDPFRPKRPGRRAAGAGNRLGESTR